MFARVVIIGVGLIGGSLALALDRRQAAHRIVGLSRHSSDLARALQLGVIDEDCPDPRSALAGADLIVVATPVAQAESVLKRIQPYISLKAIVTDVGSTKGDVIAAARRALGGKFPQFVPGHPIAGKEQSGVDAAEAELFQGRRCVLTPTPDTAGHCVDAVRDLWVACGAMVSEMSPEQHDAVFASVSHLPHLLSFALMTTIAGQPDAALKFAHAGGGFRDFTRIAAGSPEMWRDICLANASAIFEQLDAYEAELHALRQIISAQDAPCA